MMSNIDNIQTKNRNLCYSHFYITRIVYNLFIAISFFLISSCASSPNTADLIVLKSAISSRQYKVAILPFKYKYIRKYLSYADIETPLNASDIVMTGVESELLRSGKFKVIEREHLLRILDEQKLNMTGLTQDNGFMIGKLLNADGIIVGEVVELTTLKNVVNLNGRCTMTMKLIDVKSGEIILIFQIDEKVPFGDYMAALREAMKKLSDEINNKL